MEERLKRIRLKELNPALRAKVLSRVKASVAEEKLSGYAGFDRGFWAVAALVFIFLCVFVQHCTV